MPRMPRNPGPSPCPSPDSGVVIINCGGGGSSAEQDKKIDLLEQKLNEAVAKMTHDIDMVDQKATEAEQMGSDFVTNFASGVGYIGPDMQVGKATKVKDLLKEMLYNPEAEEEMDIFFWQEAWEPTSMENTKILGGWIKETVTYAVRNTGIKHTYTPPTEDYYPAFAFPAILGDLQHIYQDVLYSVDLINNFTKKHVMKDGKKYTIYAYPEAVVGEPTTLEFLWKDKEN